MFDRVLNIPDEFSQAFVTFFSSVSRQRARLETSLSNSEETWALNCLHSWIKFMKYQEIRQNRTKRENFDICFYIIFENQYQSFTSGRETRYQALPLPIFQICPIFLNLLRSKVLSRLAICGATRTYTKILNVS